jgi:hypothetical protein
VDKPYSLFVDAPRRSKIVNSLTKVDVSHTFIAEHIQAHYQVWFEHYMTAINRAMPHTLPQVRKKEKKKKKKKKKSLLLCFKKKIHSQLLLCVSSLLDDSSFVYLCFCLYYMYTPTVEVA